jgi:tetratricopeptide (TPR) repeat protein
VIARCLAAALAELGEFAEAIAAGEEGLRIAQTVGHPYSEVWARWGLGYVHLHHGDFAAATRVLEQGVALCRGIEIRFALPFVAASLGSAYLWSGRTTEAVQLLEEAVEAITAMRFLGTVRGSSRSWPRPTSSADGSPRRGSRRSRPWRWRTAAKSEARKPGA